MATRSVLTCLPQDEELEFPRLLQENGGGAENCRLSPNVSLPL